MATRWPQLAFGQMEEECVVIVEQIGEHFTDFFMSYHLMQMQLWYSQIAVGIYCASVNRKWRQNPTVGGLFCFQWLKAILSGPLWFVTPARASHSRVISERGEGGGGVAWVRMLQKIGQMTWDTLGALELEQGGFFLLWALLKALLLPVCCWIADVCIVAKIQEHNRICNCILQLCRCTLYRSTVDKALISVSE